MANTSRFLEILAEGGIKDGDIYEHIDVKVCNEGFQVLVDELNSLIFKPEKISKEIKEDGIAHAYFAELCEHWVSYLGIAFEEKLFDMRNESSCKVGKIICDNDVFFNVKREQELFKKEYKFLEDYTFDEYLAVKMVSEHRTIQQTFSKLVLYYLYTYGRPSVKEALQKLVDDKILEEEFWRLPLI